MYNITIFQTAYMNTYCNKVRDTDKFDLVDFIFFLILFGWNKPKMRLI